MITKKIADKITIIPTVLANNKEEFDKRLAKLLLCSKELQIDFMDGQFVPSKGIDLEDIPDLTRWKEWSFEAHVMAYHPNTWIEEIAKKGFKRMIFHYEAIEDNKIKELADNIREHNMMPVLALNPETPISRMLEHAKHVDGILFLGVHPGFNSAPYIKDTPKRILELCNKKKSKDKCFIQVDGGMTPETILAVVKAGATRINSGSYVGDSPDPKLAVKTMYDAICKPLVIYGKANNQRNTSQKIAKQSNKKINIANKKINNKTINQKIKQSKKIPNKK